MLAENFDDDLHELTVRVSREDKRRIGRLANRERRLLRDQAGVLLGWAARHYQPPPEVRPDPRATEQVA